MAFLWLAIPQIHIWIFAIQSTSFFPSFSLSFSLAFLQEKPEKPDLIYESRWFVVVFKYLKVQLFTTHKLSCMVQVGVCVCVCFVHKSMWVLVSLALSLFIYLNV